MQKPNLFQALVIALWFGIFTPAGAQDNASYDPQQNAWRLYYQDTETDEWVNKSYIARTATDPKIKTTIIWKGNQFAYNYRVQNGSKARQTVGIIQIWGIPQVSPPQSLPTVTASIRVDQHLWMQQSYDRHLAKSKWDTSIVQSPKGWSGNLATNEKTQQTSFIWLPGLKDTDSDGVEPGQSVSGFSVIRPELPGVARTLVQGRIEEPWVLDILPDTPFWKQKVEEIQNQDYLLIPVLAPVIQIPQPYNGAELARRVKAHVQTWVKYGHATADTVDKLNRQFVVMIPALEAGNKTGVKESAIAMLTETFRHHPGMTHKNCDEDEDMHDGASMKHPHKVSSTATAQAMDRTAARVLTFDLMYLLSRM